MYLLSACAIRRGLNFILLDQSRVPVFWEKIDQIMWWNLIMNERFQGSRKAVSLLYVKFVEFLKFRRQNG